MYLRQSTSQVIRFGPCLDSTDGITEEIALTLAQADMRLSKDGGAFAQKSAAGNATHDSDGWYSTTFSTTDTATVGELRLNVHQPANMLPVWDRWWVLEEAVYDLLYGAGATGRVTLAAVTHTGAVIPTVSTLTGHTAQTADHTAGIADIPTVAEFDARTLLAADYFDPAADTVVNVTNVATLTGHTVQTGDTFVLANGASGFVATKVDTAAILVRLPVRLTRNTAHANFQFLMVLASDGVTPATGLTVTGGVTIDLTAEATLGQTITELANGMYRIDLTAANLNGLNITLRFSGTAARDRVITIVMQP